MHNTINDIKSAGFSVFSTEQYKDALIPQQSLLVRNMNTDPFMDLDIEVKILHESARIPTYHTKGSAGVDLRACLDEPLNIHYDQTIKIRTGLAVNIKNNNFVGIILPRSGLATKNGVVLANTVGVIDSDYQGEIFLAMTRRLEGYYTVRPGDRIAQMLFMPVFRANLIQVEGFSSTTQRGNGGFGSTGAS